MSKEKNMVIYMERKEVEILKRNSQKLKKEIDQKIMAEDRDIIIFAESIQFIRNIKKIKKD